MIWWATPEEKLKESEREKQAEAQAAPTVMPLLHLERKYLQPEV